MNNNKSYRIKADVGNEKVINVELQQDINILEILSLKINQEDVYKLHSSNYGVIVGRVVANGGYGITNAKVSVFIELDDIDRYNNEIVNYYPYTSVMTNDKEGRRYNLLPDSSSDDCYQIVGSFPNKRLVLDNDTILEIFDKYWKYTTVTNKAGDYMIFSVPTGNQQIHVDIDLSDIGTLSQKPRDMVYKGYNITQFENSNQFKNSTSLDSLAQLYSQNQSVYVYPFWGDSDVNEIAITRCDIEIQYKFEPTCVFFGSLVTDNYAHNIGHKCSPSKFSGFNRDLVSTEGTIEMIRETLDGLVEEYQIQGNKLIDGDGVWCYQIPMNLDYVGTDEYGNIVPTDDPNKGIPTRTSVRFRVSSEGTKSEAVSRHRAKYLIPNNPEIMEDAEHVVPHIDNGKTYNNYYEFGSATPSNCFRSLYWNKVYSVKSYIPRIQTTHKVNTTNYNSLRSTNLSNDANPAPFNKVRFKLMFAYRVICVIMMIIIQLLCFINKFVIGILNSICLPIPFIGPLCPFKLRCIRMEGGLSEDNDENVEYMPCCNKKSQGYTPCVTPGCTKESDLKDLEDVVQQTLSQEYDTINLDFNNDWINGCIYMPLWYWRKTPKKKFLFGLFSKKAVNSFCNCNKPFGKLRVLWGGSLNYGDDKMLLDLKPQDIGAEKWHEDSWTVETYTGVIKEVQNRDGLNIYYYSPGNPLDYAYKTNENPIRFVRLYSTDIILLGSLNSCDLNSLPQPFKDIPSTTANVPFLRTIRMSGDYLVSGNTETEGEVNNNDELIENGTIEITGMDWLNDGHRVNPKYSQGLLMDISCTEVNTLPKSMINVERMSELNVGLDILYEDYYVKNGVLQNEVRKVDGMITRYELMKGDTRAEFASLNHNGLTNFILDKNTGYDSYKLKYIYPIDFDGRLNSEAKAFTSTSEWKTYDYQDPSYIDYRFGPSGVRHWYKKDGGYQFPLYNNSFYFYFGIKEGSTAIDKFNKMFFSECYKNTKYPFTMSLELTPSDWCTYKCDGTVVSSKYGVISVKLEGIKTPYSYSLSDDDGNELISEEGLYNDRLIFGVDVISGGGGYETSGETNVKYDGFNKNGVLKYYLTGEEVEPQKYIENGTYKLTITDARGNNATQIVNLEQSPIDLEYSVNHLGTKYYDGVSKPSDICNDNEYYGEIHITKIIIDGNAYGIISATSAGGDNSLYHIKTKNGEELGCEYDVELKVIPNVSGDSFYRDCTCNETINHKGFEFKDGELIFRIFKPQEYSFTITQICNGEANDNSNNIIIEVNNGKPFDMLLNDTPVRFILGDIENVNNYNENFYPKNGKVTDATALSGWYMTHKEEAYRFPKVDDEHASLYSDYVASLRNYGVVKDENGDTVEQLTDEQKYDIAVLKFESMFNLSKAAYVADDSSQWFGVTHVGGKTPILYRGAYPMYEEFSELGIDDKLESYIHDSIGYVACDSKHPNIVGNNYCYVNEKEGKYFPLTDEDIKAYFNPLFSEKNNLGNYFAAFTNNGGIVPNDETSCKQGDDKYQQIPFKADNLFNNGLCIGSENESTSIWTEVVNKHSTFNPYLRTEFVDRRFDYDFFIMTPYVGEEIEIEGEDDTWRLGRFSGVTYNGIEMAYDNTYNVVGENLEYTCDINGVDKQITFNNSKDVNRKFYKLELKCGPQKIDMRDYYWATNKSPEKNDLYNIIDHSGDTTLYNDDFSSDNYPTRRLIDIGKLPSSNVYSFTQNSCSYDMTLSTNDVEGVNNIVAETSALQAVEFDINCTNKVDVIDSNLEAYANSNAFNVLFTSNGLKFDAKVLKAKFKLKEDTSNSTHYCRTKVPRLYTIKDFGVDGSKNELDVIKKSKNISDIDVYLRTGIPYDIVETSNGVTIKDDYFMKSDNATALYDSDSDFKNLVFDKIDSFIGVPNTWANLSNPIIGGYTTGIAIKSPRLIAIGLDRDYLNSNSDLLLKRIRVVDFSSIYDLRGFEIKNVTTDIIDGKGGDAEVDVEVDVDVTVTVPGESGSTSSGSGGGTGTGTGSGEVTTHSQVIEFDIVTENSGFIDIDKIQFLFKFTIDGEVYIKNDVKYTSSDDNTIHFKCIWNSSMNNLLLGKLTDNVKCQVFAKMPNKFIYAFSFIIPNVAGTNTLIDDN